MQCTVKGTQVPQPQDGKAARVTREGTQVPVEQRVSLATLHFFFLTNAPRQEHQQKPSNYSLMVWGWRVGRV